MHTGTIPAGEAAALPRGWIRHVIIDAISAVLMQAKDRATNMCFYLVTWMLWCFKRAAMVFSAAIIAQTTSNASHRKHSPCAFNGPHSCVCTMFTRQAALHNYCHMQAKPWNSARGHDQLNAQRRTVEHRTTLPPQWMGEPS